MIAELDATVNELTDLIKRINKTNSLTTLQDNMTITDALDWRDTILLERSVYDALVNAAVASSDRYSQSEIKTISTVNIAELQAQMDRMSRDCRELDTKIQQSNWNIELRD